MAIETPVGAARTGAAGAAALVHDALVVTERSRVFVVMGALFLVLAYAGRGAFPRWLADRPGRLTRFTAGALLAAGTFTFAYWVLRVPSRFGIGWWPSMPWS